MKSSTLVSAFVLSSLPAFAGSPASSVITTPEEAVRRILLREPTAEEKTNFTTFAQKNGLAALCRVLLNSNEFLFMP